VLEPDGWFHTGDIGVRQLGRLTTDQKKDLFKTSEQVRRAVTDRNQFKADCSLASYMLIEASNRKLSARSSP
jgi:long-chain acyl-CoA synthetase